MGVSDKEVVPTLGAMVSDRRFRGNTRALALQTLVDTFTDVLDDRQREIVFRRFGLAGRSAATLREIAADYGVTQERIRQIEIRAMFLLRESVVASTRMPIFPMLRFLNVLTAADNETAMAALEWRFLTSGKYVDQARELVVEIASAEHEWNELVELDTFRGRRKRPLGREGQLHQLQTHLRVLRIDIRRIRADLTKAELGRQAGDYTSAQMNSVFNHEQATEDTLCRLESALEIVENELDAESL